MDTSCKAMAYFQKLFIKVEANKYKFKHTYISIASMVSKSLTVKEYKIKKLSFDPFKREIS